MYRSLRRLFFAFLGMSAFLGVAFVAHAEVSPAQLESSMGERVLVTLTSGDQRVATIETYDHQTVVIRDQDGNVGTLATHEIDRMERYHDASSASSESDENLRAENTHDAVIHDAMDRAERERAMKREVRKTGRGLIISGSILLAIGLGFEIGAIATAAQVRRSSDPVGGLFGTSIAIGYAVVGAPFVLTGAGLLTGGLVKRGKARRKAKRELEYSVAPSFHRGGGGAQLRLAF